MERGRVSLAAARRLAQSQTDTLKPSPTAPIDTALETDGSGRRWLRFYDPASLAPLDLDDIRRRSDALTGKIVVVGSADGAVHETPVGRLTTTQLVAQTIAGYRASRAVETSLVATVAGWLVAAGWTGARSLWCGTTRS